MEITDGESRNALNNTPRCVGEPDSCWEELLADLLVGTESRNDDTRSIAKNLKTNADAIYECLG